MTHEHEHWCGYYLREWEVWVEGMKGEKLKQLNSINNEIQFK